jgi:hypothetical protein
VSRAFAWTAEGRRPGSANHANILFADCRDPVASGKRGPFSLEKGDVALLVTAIGGGWAPSHPSGAALLRDGYLVILLQRGWCVKNGDG